MIYVGGQSVRVNCVVGKNLLCFYVIFSIKLVFNLACSTSYLTAGRFQFDTHLIGTGLRVHMFIQIVFVLTLV